MKKRAEKGEKLHILLVLTGGTIGTMVAADGKRRLAAGDDVEAADGRWMNAGSEPMLIAALRERVPELALEFSVRIPYQVLSEHMTLRHLEKLAECLRGEDLTEYDGVFITHGSDTLAYTAAFLGELMRGCPVPVFLLAAQRPIEDTESNGVENTLAAVQLLESMTESGDICGDAYGKAVPKCSDGNKPVSEDSSRFDAGTDRKEMKPAPVYVPYRNSDGKMYLHRAEELRQCEPGSDDFFSRGMRELTGSREVTAKMPSGRVSAGEAAEERWNVPDISPTPDVLLLHPYVGIRYDCVSLMGIRAVLHTMYHSSTAPKELTGFLDRCGEAGVPCYILPCDPENFHYETTAELLEHGAIPLSGLTEESAYMRLILGENTF